MAKSKRAAAKKSVKKPAKKAPKKTVKKAAAKPKRQQEKKVGKRFLVIYHAPMDAMVQTVDFSPEQHEAGIALWRAWAQRCGKKLADLGSPLANGRRLNSKGSITPSIKEVSGFSLLEAENWDEVFALLEGHPHISGWHPEATIEVHETMQIPGM